MTTAPKLPLFWLPHPKSKLLGENYPCGCNRLIYLTRSLILRSRLGRTKRVKTAIDYSKVNILDLSWRTFLNRNRVARNTQLSPNEFYIRPATEGSS